jgi:glycosyltransferase involved in cell wall biosynthesis
MNVLVLAALTDATGNAVTARRLASQLEKSHRVILVDSISASLESLRELVSSEKIDAALGVHALLAGPFLRALGLPYVLVFGGTDLYEPMHELHQNQMARAVAAASALVAFSPENLARAEWMWPSAQGRVHCLPQAVDVPAELEDYDLRSELGLAADARIALLPTGIRRVKDPLHVAQAFSDWHREDPRVHLVIAGAVLELDYAEPALETLTALPGVHYLPPLPRSKMLAAMRRADLVLNTSLSEGMCGSVLEAMALRTPVIARRNAGNESLIVHGHTGLLYDSPDECVQWARALLNSALLSARLARTASRHVSERHSPRAEEQAFAGLVAELKGAKPSTVAAAGICPGDYNDGLEIGLAAADELGFDARTRAALASELDWIRATPERRMEGRRLAALLATAPPSRALAEIADWLRADPRATDAEPGRDAPSRALLFLALTQVPLARARLSARGVSEDVIRETLFDLVEWAEHQRAITGDYGVTLTLLKWTQRYLRGELLRFGPMQFDLRPFAGAFRVFRRDREIRAVSLEGKLLDLRAGVVLDQSPALDPEQWKLCLEPGSPVLDLHIQGSFKGVGLREMVRRTREALGVFGRLSPETAPEAVCGETWRLDPQLLEHVPRESGAQDLQAICHLYPSAITEEMTLQRLFGPGVRRTDLRALTARAELSDVHRAVARYLEDPTRRLVARSGFMLADELDSIPEWT